MRGVICSRARENAAADRLEALGERFVQPVRRGVELDHARADGRAVAAMRFQRLDENHVVARERHGDAADEQGAVCALVLEQDDGGGVLAGAEEFRRFGEDQAAKAAFEDAQGSGHGRKDNAPAAIALGAGCAYFIAKTDTWGASRPVRAGAWPR
jgi:hypothetical protein